MRAAVRQCTAAATMEPDAGEVIEEFMESALAQWVGHLPSDHLTRGERLTRARRQGGVARVSCSEIR